MLSSFARLRTSWVAIVHRCPGLRRVGVERGGRQFHQLDPEPAAGEPSSHPHDRGVLYGRI